MSQLSKRTPIGMYHLLYLVIIPYATCISPKKALELSFLTKNTSKIWLNNNTVYDDIPGSFCDVCCLKLTDTSAKKVCGRHTLCRYKSDVPGPNCNGFIEMEFSAEEKALIVDAHNTMRNRIALGNESRGNPGPQARASNMRAVSWDDELNLLARRWVRQCVFAHDLCRDVRRFPVGQNIARGGYAINNDLGFVIDWYDYVELANRTVVEKFHLTPTDALSQYTQLAWAETYLVGCARVALQTAEGPDVTYREHFVCNYGPTGNIPGHAVYRIGEPCSSCPRGTACSVEYEGLCAAELMYEIKFENRTSTERVEGDSSGDGREGVYFSGLCLLGLFTYALL